MDGIYLDNAATSRVKPKSVRDEMLKYYDEIGCSPGRGGYRCSLEASRLVFDARNALCKLFNHNNPDSVIFTHNITQALNMVLKGMLKKGDHVITTMMEHNAVVRPLNKMVNEDIIKVDYMKADEKGMIDINDLKNSIKDETKMIVMNHASNVTGTILPIEAVSKIAEEYNLIFVVDSAQTAGSHKIDLDKINIDVLTFTGHKGLFGPTGTGGFIINEDIYEKMDSYIEGGTGSISEKDFQPGFLPDKFESGTKNTMGIIGLKAGVEYILDVGIENIHKKKQNLTKRLLDGLDKIDNVRIYGPKDVFKQTSTISITIEGFDMGDFSFILDDKYNIMTRSGLHCAPYAHKSIGTYPEGTLRFSIGYFNSEEDIDKTLEVIEKLVKNKI